MTERNFTKELLYSYYADMENGDDVESIDYRSLIYIITELCGRIEQLEKDNKLLKSYAWEQLLKTILMKCLKKQSVEN